MIELEAEVITAIENGKKVDAIKKLREIRGVGLKESKELVDLYSVQNKPKNSSSNSHSKAHSKLGAKIGFIILLGAIGYIAYKLTF